MELKVKSKNRGFIEKTIEPEILFVLQEMGNSRKKIIKFQRTRIQSSVVIAFIFLALGVLIDNWLLIGAIVGPIIFYKAQSKKVNNLHTSWKFQRQLQFSKFCRLLIPYLKQENNQSLYAIFNKLLNRMETEEDKNSLYRLMTEMSENPNSVQPFVHFADRSSGTDSAVLFMTTVFDYSQTAKDASVITELGEQASEELMLMFDEILNFKLKKFVFYPTKVVMLSFIIVLGFAAGVLWMNIPKEPLGM